MSASETQEGEKSPSLSELYPMFCNTPDDILYANIAHTIELGIPIIFTESVKNEAAILVGGGPSLKYQVESIRLRQNNGYKVFALNGAGHFLLENNITPDSVIILDAREENIRFVKGHNPKTNFYISSQCHPSLFDYLKDRDVTAWHPNMNGHSGVKEHRRTVLIGGGTSVGLRAMRLVHVLGYRSLHLFGYDSSYEENEGHAYEQIQDEKFEQITCNGRTFKTTPWMLRQAGDFQDVASELASLGCNITVHGDGLLPEVARGIQQSQKPISLGEKETELTAFYDLRHCPASYDFVVFLALAEQERRTKNYQKLKIVIVPGPNHGFRDDMIPPNDPEKRKQMLWGIVMQSCRLVKSVSTVVLAGDRHEAALHESENIFPVSYLVDQPFPFYGFMRLVQGHTDPLFPCFEAPQDSLDYVDKWLPENTVTITLREASHLPSRNSNLEEWIKAAHYLKTLGYNVVFIRDTEQAYRDITGFTTCHVASYDLCVRMALYERARLNLFISGPFTLATLDKKIEGMTFAILREGEPIMTEDSWRLRGFRKGSQFPNLTHHKLVWEMDTFDVIVREVLNQLNPLKQAN